MGYEYHCSFAQSDTSAYINQGFRRFWLWSLGAGTGNSLVFDAVYHDEPVFVCSEVFVCREGENVGDVADELIVLPSLPDIFMPSLAIIPLQMFAYYIAVILDYDVDKPRNLAKSVTVE